MAEAEIPTPRRIASVQRGQPRTLEWQGRSLRTAFVKQPALVPLRLGFEGLEGDAQADRRIHGGPHKVAYAYPREHLPYWRELLQTPDLGAGAFGENFSTEGLLETRVLLGERFRFGQALVEVSQPRFPCLKMAARHRREDLPHLFRRSGRSGFYLRVIEEGTVAAGDTIEAVFRPEHGVSVHRLVKLFYSLDPDWEQVEQALAVPDLPAEWHRPLAARLRNRQ